MNTTIACTPHQGGQRHPWRLIHSDVVQNGWEHGSLFGLIDHERVGAQNVHVIFIQRKSEVVWNLTSDRHDDSSTSLQRRWFIKLICRAKKTIPLVGRYQELAPERVLRSTIDRIRQNPCSLFQDCDWPPPEIDQEIINDQVDLHSDIRTVFWSSCRRVRIADTAHQSNSTLLPMWYGPQPITMVPLSVKLTSCSW